MPRSPPGSYAEGEGEVPSGLGPGEGGARGPVKEGGGGGWGPVGHSRAPAGSSEEGLAGRPIRVLVGPGEGVAPIGVRLGPGPRESGEDSWVSRVHPGSRDHSGPSGCTWVHGETQGQEGTAQTPYPQGMVSGCGRHHVEQSHLVPVHRADVSGWCRHSIHR